MAGTGTEQLKRVLKPVHLWAIGVGLVISGEYFGWNLGWGVAGTIGLLIATIVVTIMYVTFIFSYTELTAAIPHAGGAFAYAYRAMGPFGGLIAGYATLIDFLLATPAIAVSLGAYLHFLYPAIPIMQSAMLFNATFILLNISGVKESATFSVFITLLAVAELLLYMGVVAPHFKMASYLTDPMPFGWPGVFAALPFAVWFYLAIEGMAMVVEEVKEPKKNIPKGYISAIITLVFLALAVMVLTGGITNWHRLSTLDYPLPEAIGIVLGKANGLTRIFASIGLFGLIASLHGTILASSRQVFAMARSGYLPRGLAQINHRFKTPHRALISGGVISFIAIYIGTTAQIIILSVLGAVVMYMMSMISLFILRKKEPGLDRPFISPFYPVFPAVALVISIICLFAIMYFNLAVGLIFFAVLALAIIIFMLMGKHKIKIMDDVLMVQAESMIKGKS
ncbi:ethanolamine permease [Mucilaginibacter sp. UR6-11]|uniref:ethanolamine permease n=1 Tax=Mucilaginibacter sp. UR6-11 TaxID=1435644 RepID=UPI001E645002|nr:ethanolamine permease [Mucilaginibacter sp. UR6-11]MCC8425906.1 ethanolamine permease [Mucilaginibacter sp. UR6-11]